jgi:hypothetical protein
MVAEYTFLKMTAGVKKHSLFSGSGNCGLEERPNPDLCKTALAVVVVSGLWPESALLPEFVEAQPRH